MCAAALALAGSGSLRWLFESQTPNGYKFACRMITSAMPSTIKNHNQVSQPSSLNRRQELPHTPSGKCRQLLPLASSSWSASLVHTHVASVLLINLATLCE